MTVNDVPELIGSRAHALRRSSEFKAKNWAKLGDGLHSNLDLAEKVNIKRQISGLDARRDELIAERYARKKRIRDDINKMLDEIADSLKLAPEESPLFTIRWEVSA